MTRETKIGLLVGLAFIIVIGILLSDHATNSSEPPQAALNTVGNNVRSGTAVPPSNVSPNNLVGPQPVVGASQPVPSQADLANSNGTAAVKVDGPQNGTPPQVLTIKQSNQPQNGVASNDSTPDVPARTETPGQQAIADAAHQQGEEIVTPGHTSTDAQPGTSAGKQYVAQPGDTVSRMAGRFLGANTRTNRDAIIKANPSLRADPDKVIVGKTYSIPASADVVAQNENPSGETPGKTSVATESDYTYTTQPGDTLSKISVKLLGSASSWRLVWSLNKEVLPNPDVVPPNVTIRIPARSGAVASAR